MAKPATNSDTTLRDFFGPEGLLARCHPQYEFRAGQLEMAEAVERAFREKRHLVVEAGTGTGKTLAYLLPALRSGRKVVISTGTKNLQEQLFFKDIPFLQRHFDPNIRACYMKGRSNYLCRQKLYDLEHQPVLKGMEEVDQYVRIRQWEKTTESGDRAELTDLPEPIALWPRIDARSETCTGQKCAQFERCFVTQMHRRAAEADLVIVNHHLFFADLAVRQDDFASILPDYHTVIFDEAHELEDVASQFFGTQVSTYRFEELARDAENALRLKGIADKRLPKLLRQLRRQADAFFDLFPGGEGRYAFENRSEFLERYAEPYSKLVDALRALEVALASLPDKPEELLRLVRRAADIRQELQFLLESTDRTYVFWYERRGRGVFLQATPIDVSQILRERLFERYDTIVLTSATLAVADRFDYLKQRLGFCQAEERVLPSHFDYRSQAMLYIPEHLPDVRDPSFVPEAADIITQLLEASRGRAFVLFTSYQQMQQIFERAAQRLDFPLLLQGTAPRTALLEKFRQTPGAVLFATSSFWQGVDVQGPQLSAVIIDRLPFAVPTDPVVRARIRVLQEDGHNAFTEYQIPEAIISLKQGFGRLIRARSDRGILAILDNRILRKQYGKLFLESLPPYRVTSDLEEVRRFFSEE
ncbi:MAG TPA: helicase C-terminal domain-containing protein [Candidatus Xenobia bacterium]|nr:helicase C-terminal domain-containing protein [Candidatus Xenobia bacterium]